MEENQLLRGHWEEKMIIAGPEHRDRTTEDSVGY